MVASDQMGAKRPSLSEFLSKHAPILLDGAMGTQLAEAGLEMGGQACIFHPDAVLDIHRRYAKAGCDLLITNTLTMNRISIETHGAGVDVKDVNISGAQLARSAALPGHYVLGDISSTGQFLEPYGSYSETQFYDTFREQADYLLAAGVDGLIVESMVDLREALCALRACRDLSRLPVLVSLSFMTVNDGGRTLMGNAATEACLALAEAGADAIGANCGDLEPHETAVIVSLMKECTDLPIIAQPNAGKPELVDGRTVFDMGPEVFAEGILECVAAGAQLVGGCCGTTPEHIRRVREKLDGRGHDNG